MTTTITNADLFPDDEGMIVVAKDAVDGSVRYISEVPMARILGASVSAAGGH